MPKYIVINEYTLGYLIPAGTQLPMVGFLRASILRGSRHNEMDGWGFLYPSDSSRPATEKDFEDYRVCLPPDFKTAQIS